MTADFTPLATAAMSDAAVIGDYAEQAAARTLVQVSDTLQVLVHRDDQSIEEFDMEQYLPVPTRKRGAVALADADSLVAYIERHKSTVGTTIWSDLDRARIVAVLDDHQNDSATAGWGQHRATLQLRSTPDWDHWIKNDGKLLDQQTFAEHIEDGADAIRDPAPATMLEVAQSFQAKRGVNFSSSRHLGGEIEFAFEETVAARAGQKGKLEVPSVFTLGVAPFEGSSLYELKARLRFVLQDSTLRLGYRLIRPDRARRTAFDEIVSAVSGRFGPPGHGRHATGMSLPTSTQTRIEQSLAFGRSLDWLYARYRRRDVDAAIRHLDSVVATDAWLAGRREARRLRAAGVHPHAARLLAARVARQAAEQEEAS